ncbi:MAG TPA: diacylglycerol kinase family protein [Gemmatimonadaceae bacterium]|nr:diacylglycerol kinase family protein [Gemmatimonadaceae bacterium]
MRSVAMIVNAAAGRGRIRSTLPALVDIFRARGIGNVFETTARGDEEALTHRAISAGAKTIVAVGGDGTCGRIADAMMRSGSPCRLAVIPAGTGNDFAKTLGVERYTPVQTADLVVAGRETRIDIGLAEGHYFLNSCGFGFDASVLESSNRVRFLKGDAVYIYSALRQLFTYRGMDVSANGVAALKPGRMLMVTVSNGRYLGGAFRIAPHASVVDGKLDACFFGDSNVVERARLFAGALRGTHLGMRGVTSASVQELSLTFAAPPSMEIDGELRTARSSTVRLECVPQALSVLAAPGALA